MHYYEHFLKRILMKQEKLKLIITVIRCQNLTAVDNQVPIVQQIAGEEAKCSADPYIVI